MSNEMVADSGVPTPGVAGLSQIERVVDTFVAPSKTFKDILRSASWWLPLLLLIVASLGSAFVVDHQVGFDRVYENQIRLSSKAEERLSSLTPEQKAQNLKISTVVTKYTTYGSFVFILIFIAIYALILWASFNFGLGAKTTFGQVFAVSMYSALPYLVTTILTVAMLYFGGNVDAYDYKNPVGTNLAYFMPDASPLLRGLLSSFDIVKLWSDVLVVIGMAIVAKKSIMQSAVVVGIFWVIGVLFTVAAAMFT
jgi:hypothetical protein